ncbi:DUF4382 domain-containing protein [Planktothrix mougeotii]|uniref:DUF4382 domain-containing protein n=1 Tax=Planktothrix mougeotii LEGE 06226 TaxID=1828728 RepID=A0ABR9UHW4_9CYAN|nr:DUF4382 domain-containing protein [Planktothrix mougeotii]MBE9146049.1 DUF4382 domain-containing protein [Planktothrix mougeotii LEGE 06226]
MKKQQIQRSCLMGFIVATLIGCSQPQTPTASTSTSETPQAQITPNSTQTGEMGLIQFQANGEDFVRKGLVSKDGWNINFDHVYLNFGEATAYQSDPPYNPEAGGQPIAKTSISLVIKKTVDLAEGDENTQAIVINEVPAPPGKYNAISWNLNKGTEGILAGQVMVIEGVAKKGDQQVPFILKFDQEMQFLCGDYVGEQRKGVLQPGGKADLEATFHFDHLFGNGKIPATEEPNTTALGFEPLSKIATNGELVADLPTLKQKLSPADYQTLMNILPSMAHVGEGHCQELTLKK